ncbi:hypothetical protein TNCV_2543761 [Trichonephila clavipes]|nr:hypothetical protein TNCV_2543761 [Trichonephila clavipes]
MSWHTPLLTYAPHHGVFNGLGFELRIRRSRIPDNNHSATTAVCEAESPPIGEKSHRSSLVVKDPWLTCHEFEPSTAEDPSCWGAMHVKSVESSNVLT